VREKKRRGKGYFRIFPNCSSFFLWSSTEQEAFFGKLSFFAWQEDGGNGRIIIIIIIIRANDSVAFRHLFIITPRASECIQLARKGLRDRKDKNHPASFATNIIMGDIPYTNIKKTGEVLLTQAYHIGGFSEYQGGLGSKNRGIRTVGFWFSWSAVFSYFSLLPFWKFLCVCGLYYCCPLLSWELVSFLSDVCLSFFAVHITTTSVVHSQNPFLSVP